MAKKAPAEVKENVIPILDGSFEVVNYELVKISTGFGNFDLANLTQDQAELLVKKGVKCIRKAE
jgi:hypothetical protein